MGFGKRILELSAAAAGLLFLAALIWCLVSGFQDSSYEEQGTLVMEERGKWNPPANEFPENASVPAFVTKPGFSVLGPHGGTRSAKGL